MRPYLEGEGGAGGGRKRGRGKNESKEWLQTRSEVPRLMRENSTLDRKLLTGQRMTRRAREPSCLTLNPLWGGFST